MTIHVCSLPLIHAQIKAHQPARVISLLDPYTPFPETAYGDRHLRVTMHDIVGEAEGHIHPARDHMDTLLDFIGGWDKSAPLLIHCYAGISRSTASAFIAACVHNPRADEMEIARALRAASTRARPNGLLVALADDALGRDGRMSHAIEETGRDLPWTDDYEGAPPFFIPSVYGAKG
jgi:predicted protein tyrosine phosphatase